MQQVMVALVVQQVPVVAQQAPGVSERLVPGPVAVWQVSGGQDGLEVVGPQLAEVVDMEVVGAVRAVDVE